MADSEGKVDHDNYDYEFDYYTGMTFKRIREGNWHQPQETPKVDVKSDTEDVGNHDT